MDSNLTKQNPKVIMVGGGSGGHLSIIKGMIDYLKTTDFPIQTNILVVGGKLGMISDPGKSLDERRIPEFGVPFRFIRGGKLHRALASGFSFSQLLTTAKLLFGFFYGFADAWKVLREFKPNKIFAAGGYVTFPIILVGWLFRIEVIIHEQTLSAGLANRLGGLFAKKILLTFKESSKYFPKGKSLVVGNIVRNEILNPSPVLDSQISQFINNPEKPNLPLIYVTGGSLGAHKINLFIEENLEDLLDRYLIILQTGENELYHDYNRIYVKCKSLSSDLQKRVILTKYLHEEIGEVLSRADIIVCRPGANTLYELSILNKKAIIVPLWVTSKSDQVLNAKWYVENYSGEIIQEKELSLNHFIALILKLLSKDSRNPKPPKIASPKEIWESVVG